MPSNPFNVHSICLKSIQHSSRRIIITELLALIILVAILFLPGGRFSPVTSSNAKSQKDDFIKWVDFTVTADAMNQALDYDTATWKQDPHLDWIELLAYLGARYGGDFSKYKTKDMKALADKLINKETSMADLTKDMKYYSYYLEAYSAVLGGMVGQYETVAGDSPPQTQYGLIAYSPIAKSFPYSDYDDFGVSRSYGYRRQHLGHDLMGQTGTPIICVEGGTVEALGWNQYGGWRIGIRSFDGKRYYYYAHLRQNYPYQSNLSEGCTVNAGDVIGYMGRTGYSAKENTNNIDSTHLHFGLQLIFDDSQKEGSNEIWISCYELIKFLSTHRTEVYKKEGTKEWDRVVGQNGSKNTNQ